MKRTRFVKKAVPLSAGIFAVLLFGCTDFSSLQKPESLTVASNNGVFEFPMGSTSAKFSDYVNISTMREKITGTEGKIGVYDYWPDKSGNTLQFLLNYPIADVPLDFGELLNNSDFIGDINEDMTQKFKVDPDTSMNLATVAFDLNAGIKDHFDVHPVNTDFAMVETDTTIDIPANLAQRQIEITTPSFSTLDFETGTFRITFNKTDPHACSTDFTILLSASLQTSDGTVISESAGAVELKDGNSIDLPMAGKSMTTSMKIVFSGTVGGGATLSREHTYTISTGLTPDTTFSRVTGLTMTNEELGSNGTVTIPETTIPLTELEEYLYEATVAEGEFEFGIPVSNWSGVTTESDFTFSGEAIPLDASEIVDKGTAGYLIDKKIDLAGKKIDLSKSATKVNGTVRLSLNNATVTPTAGGSLALSGKCNLRRLSDAKVKIAKVIDSSTMTKTVTKDLSENDSAKMIKEAQFSRVGFTGEITCDLPMNGLVVTPSFTSTIFGIDGSDPLEQEILLTDGSGEIAMSRDLNPVVVIEPGSTDASKKTLDFDIAVDITGRDVATGQACDYVLIPEMEIGKEYTFKPEIALDYTLDHVTFTLDDGTLSLSDEIETNIDLNEMIFGTLEGLSDIIPHINMSSAMTSYITVSRPDFTPTAGVTEDPLAALKGFDGTVQAKYDITDSEGAVQADQITYLVGTETQDATINLVSRSYDLDALGTEENDYLITRNLFTDGTYSSRIDTLSSVLNAHPDNLRFVYDLHLSGSSGNELTLTADQLESLKQDAEGVSSSSLKISMAIVFPFEFEIVDGGIHVNDLLATIDKQIDGDLLKRGSKDDTKYEKIKEYSEIVRSIQMAYKIDNYFLVGLDADVKMNFFDPATPDDAISKAIKSDSQTHVFQLTKEEVTKCMDYFPLNFTVSLDIDEGTVSIPRIASFNFGGTVSVTTGGEVKVWGGD